MTQKTSALWFFYISFNTVATYALVVPIYHFGILSNGTGFSGIQYEIIETLIRPYLQIHDDYRSLLRVNRRFYDSLKNDSIALLLLQSTIQNILDRQGFTTDDIKSVKSLEHRLRLSEIYKRKRSGILQTINAPCRIHPDHYDIDARKFPVLSGIQQIYHALNLNIISIEEYNNLSFPGFTKPMHLKLNY